MERAVRPQPVRVAIDLETTGLSLEQDAIVEIGAVKFAGERVLDTFETFVSSRSQMPYRIQRLTGIKPEQLRNAPALGAVLPRLHAFLGDVPLVGHVPQRKLARDLIIGDVIDEEAGPLSQHHVVLAATTEISEALNLST